MNTSLYFLVSLSLTFFNSLATADEGMTDLVKSIQKNEEARCHWVNEVGDTEVSDSVTWVEMGPECSISANADFEISDRKATGLCKGIIRCSGVGEGWGDIYFEDIHCPGEITATQNVSCGRLGGREARGYRLAEGTKSCLSYFASTEATLSTTASGDHQIKQTPQKRSKGAQ